MEESKHGQLQTEARNAPSQNTRRKMQPASPTVATDSIMITAAIDAHERRNVTTIDIPGAFLHAYNVKETIMLLRGRLAELMVQVDPQIYQK